MQSAPVYVTSDVHLGAVPTETERAFLVWLQEAAARGSCIIINGDLFDYWFEYGSVIPQGYTRALGVLAEVADSGIPIHLIGGNHDWWGGRYLEEEIGLRFHRDPVEMELAGHRILIAHGDGLGPGDYGYKALKAVLRSRPFRFAYRWLHPDLGDRIANRASSTHLRQGPPHEGQFRRAAILRSWALERLESGLLDGVVLGHSHIPVLEASGAAGSGGTSDASPGATAPWYLNAGDWVYHRTFAVLEDGALPRLLRWRDGGEAEVYENPYPAVPFTGTAPGA